MHPRKSGRSPTPPLPIPPAMAAPRPPEAAMSHPSPLQAAMDVGGDPHPPPPQAAMINPTPPQAAMDIAGDLDPPSPQAAMDIDPPPVTESPIQFLPQDALHQILARLPLRSAVSCRPVCRVFSEALSSAPFLASLPSLPLLALRYPRPSLPHPTLLALDPAAPCWLRLPLAFLPFPSSSPVAASGSALYLWADPASPSPSPHQPKSLVVCNPLTRAFRVLPQLGSAWSRHGTVIAGPGGLVIVLTELAALSHSPAHSPGWLKFSLNLPAKPRSPVLIPPGLYTLCDVGNPWRSQWKLFTCGLDDLGTWDQLERHEWGDVFDILKRPRLLRGAGVGKILMVGGLRSSFAQDAPCSTVLILRLDLATLEWDEAGRMPPEMYRCFAGSGSGGGQGNNNNKVKVFGGDGRVWFSGKKVRSKMAMWEEEEAGKVGAAGGRWSWVDGPGYSEWWVYRGFVFDAALTEIP